MLGMDIRVYCVLRKVRGKGIEVRKDEEVRQRGGLVHERHFD